MAERHVITALVRKRAELAGEIRKADYRKKKARAALAHIDETLRIMGYDKDPSLIRPRLKQKRLFRRGELLRLMLDIMRQSPEPLSDREMAIEVIRRKGWEDSPSLRLVMAKKVNGSRRYIDI